MDRIAMMAPMALTGRKKSRRVLRAFRLDTPLFRPGTIIVAWKVWSVDLALFAWVKKRNKTGEFSIK